MIMKVFYCILWKWSSKAITFKISYDYCLFNINLNLTSFHGDQITNFNMYILTINYIAIHCFKLLYYFNCSYVALFASNDII